MQGWRTLVSLLVAVAFASGCVTGAGAQTERDVATTEDAHEAAVAPVDMSLAGCIEFGAARLLPFERAQELLPPGFVPGEASEFLGLPFPTGRAVVLSGHLDCAWSALDQAPLQWADLLVYVEPPTVPGHEFDHARADLYQLAHYASGEATVAALEAVGFAVWHADVRAEFALVESVPVGGASNRVEDETVMAYEVVGTTQQPYALFARFWHQSDLGLAYVEHERAPTVMHSGSLTSCTAAAGTPFAAAFGTDCRGVGALGGVFPEPTDFTSTLHFLPGAAVAPR